MTTATPDPQAVTDEDLTRAGLPAAGRGRILLIACGALAREILDLKAANGWDHIDLACLPAILHNHPDRITDAVRAAVAEHRADYLEIFVVYADCGTGGGSRDGRGSALLCLFRRRAGLCRA